MSTLGKWLQPPPKDSLEHQYRELANQLRIKERALETTSHDLKVKTAAMQILEQKIMSSETQFTSAQRELVARSEQLKTLEAELAIRSRRLADLETDGIAAQQQVSELKSIIATQGDELRAGQQGREVLKEEIRVLREHIVQLNEGLSDRDHLRAQMAKFESAQDRVHLLEVELSDREAAHRRRVQQLEQILAERDQRIGEFDASAAAQGDELRGAQQARQTAEQAREVLKEEIRVLREQITQLNEGLADRDQLRAQVKKLESARDRVHQLEVELSDREAVHRGTIQQLEQSIAERDRRISEFDSFATAQANEVQDALETCRTAEQAREVLKEEIRVLREQITQLNEGLAHRDRLRAQVKKLESTQDRVHQLEVELSDREAAHRGTIQQLERALAERDQRIDKLVPVTHLLREKEAAIKEWERTHARTMHDLEAETAKLHEQAVAQDQLCAQHQLDEQRLQERDAQIADLTRQLQNLQTEQQVLHKEVQGIPGKDEQIDRLQKRLKELRATVRATSPSSATLPPQPPRQNGAGQNSAVAQQPRGSKPVRADDLKQISGIGPVFADTLQKLGTCTFIQIARWKPEDIKNIAKKLETDPERIKRENWIADAKKQHYRKYGERV
jgi:predicted flap endonuclease-1-like 5' DNA nuclease